ncbi:hypothetical protein [Geodermatophilus poikilotrophus]|uniref:hypothetical protein n=1 Tax=Geodermatophilus poikilotrophus TaxID=1333667 RepID=UPI000B84508A|nr:hypothetical protein [Geodermatophilus poikilotrophus]
MRVVADTHALIWYLLDDPDRRLSSAALDALEEAAATEGVVVSVASVVDICYVIRTRQTSPMINWTSLSDYSTTPALHWRPRR